VKNAEAKMTSKVTVIINGVGLPFSRDPVRLASQTKAQWTGNNINKTNAVPARRIQRALRPEAAFVRATARARRI
jgi:hypothetical protein